MSSIIDTNGLEQFGKGTINPLKETDGLLAQAISAVNDSKEDLFRYSIMPTPSATYVNKIVQYIGTTTAQFGSGGHYKCVEDNGTYHWEFIDIIGANYVNGTGTITVDQDGTLIYTYDDNLPPVVVPQLDGDYVTHRNSDGSIQSIVFTFSGGTITTTYSKSGTSEITQELTVLTGATTGKLVTTTRTGDNTSVRTTYVTINNAENENNEEENEEENTGGGE